MLSPRQHLLASHQPWNSVILGCRRCSASRHCRPPCEESHVGTLRWRQQKTACTILPRLRRPCADLRDLAFRQRNSRSAVVRWDDATSVRTWQCAMKTRVTRGRGRRDPRESVRLERKLSGSNLCFGRSAIFGLLVASIAQIGRKGILIEAKSCKQSLPTPLKCLVMTCVENGQQRHEVCVLYPDRPSDSPCRAAP